MDSNLRALEKKVKTGQATTTDLVRYLMGLNRAREISRISKLPTTAKLSLIEVYASNKQLYLDFPEFRDLFLEDSDSVAELMIQNMCLHDPEDLQILLDIIGSESSILVQSAAVEHLYNCNPTEALTYYQALISNFDIEREVRGSAVWALRRYSFKQIESSLNNAFQFYLGDYAGKTYGLKAPASKLIEFLVDEEQYTAEHKYAALDLLNQRDNIIPAIKALTEVIEYREREQFISDGLFEGFVETLQSLIESKLHEFSNPDQKTEKQILKNFTIILQAITKINNPETYLYRFIHAIKNGATTEQWVELALLARKNYYLKTLEDLDLLNTGEQNELLPPKVMEIIKEALVISDASSYDYEDDYDEGEDLDEEDHVRSYFDTDFEENYGDDDDYGYDFGEEDY